jgi:hypothetical protein
MMGGTCPTFTTTPLSFSVDTINVCQEEAVDPSSGLKAEYYVYQDSSREEPLLDFSMGQTIHSFISVISPDASIDSIRITKVDISSEGYGSNYLFSIPCIYSVIVLENNNNFLDSVKTSTITHIHMRK